MDFIETLLGHDQWATLMVLEHARNLTDADLDQSFDVGHGTLRATLSHQMDGIDFWMGLMTGIPSTNRIEGVQTVSELCDRYEQCFASFATFARTVRDEGRLDEYFTDHSGMKSTYGITILHVILHSAQHRAEDRHMLERLGVKEIWDADPMEWAWSVAASG